MHKSDQIKITHSLLRQYLMACKLALVLDLGDVCKKIYKFPAKKVLKILSGYSQYVVCFLLGNYPASEVYMPTFGNTLSVPSP